MEIQTKKLLKSVVSLVLVLSMVLCTPLTAFAATSTVNDSNSATDTLTGVKDVNGDGVINYVSFGDSVTNGYGMDGYRYEDGTNTFGFRREPEASYPVQVMDYLETQGFTVKLEQMAISGFRMDELHWMLCDCYVADEFHNVQFANWNRNVVKKLLAKNGYSEEENNFYNKYNSQFDGTVASANEILMTEYREAVENADLITINLGTNNFGTFVTNTIQEILGLKELAYDVTFEQYVDAQTAASLDYIIGTMAGQMVGSTDSSNPTYQLAYTLAKCLMYGYLGFTEHYDGAIEAIYEINPNAQVVVVDMYSMISGVNLDGSALGDNVDIDQLYNLFIDLGNFYARELSPYAHKVTHASLEVTHVDPDCTTDAKAPELFIDDFKSYSYPDNQTININVSGDGASSIIASQIQEGDTYKTTATRLFHEFIMEAMGYDPDEPASRETFNNEILSNIELLDGLVYNISDVIDGMVFSGTGMDLSGNHIEAKADVNGTIKTAIREVVGLVDTSISAIDLIYMAIAGEASARENLDLAIDGVNLASTAVDKAVSGVETATEAVDTAISGVETATEAVNTAISGVEQAEALADIIINDVAGNSSFNTSSLFESAIKKAIKEELAEIDLTEYGFTEDDHDMLADKIYALASAYSKGTMDRDDIVLEVMKFVLVEVDGKDEETAAETAEMGYSLYTIYKAEGKPAAVKAAMATQVDETTAETAYSLYEVYVENGGKDNYTAAKKATVKAAVKIGITEEIRDIFPESYDDDDIAELIVAISETNASSGKEAAVKLTISELQSELDENSINAAYAMNSAYHTALSGKENPTDAEISAAKEAAVLAGIEASITEDITSSLGKEPGNVAELVYAVASIYNNNKANGEEVAITACLIAMAPELEMTIDEDTAKQAYGLYLVYKNALGDKTDDDSKAAAKEVAVVAAISSEYPGNDSEGNSIAAAIYAVYNELTGGTSASYQQKKTAYVTLISPVLGNAELAEAIFYCYAGKLDNEGNVYSIDGHFKDEHLCKVMEFFLSFVNKTADDYNSYLQFKNLAIYLSQIANCKTIYFDALLAATEDGLDLSSIASGLMSGSLSLVEPGEDASDDDWSKYKSDSALTTLYFRFMTQDGVFTHPSEGGQDTLTDAVIKALENINPVITDETDSISVDANSKILVLGDSIANGVEGETNYPALLEEYTKIDTTNLSVNGFRINEVLALLDDNYSGDAYTTEVTANIDAAEYENKIKENDVIVVNLGAMNIGFIFKELNKYMSADTLGQTYKMTFSNIESMDTHDLGPTVDGLLSGFQGIIGTASVNESSILMLAFESYGYGYTTFTNALDDLVENIKSINSNAQIILVGQYDLINDTVYNNGTGGYFAFGDFVYHIVELMNKYMSIYATMNENVIYVDVTGTENALENDLNLAGSTEDYYNNLKKAFENAHPTAAGHESMARKISCAIGKHTAENVEWVWTDYSSATVSFTCENCGSPVSESIVPTVTTTATCVSGGTETYTAFYSSSINSEKTKDVEAYEHIYGGAPEWTWADDYSKATAKFTCTNEYNGVKCNNYETVDATPVKTTDDPTCENTGLDTYTATVTFEGNKFEDVKTSAIDATGHTYGNPVWTWADDFSKASVTVTCSVCKDGETNHTITVDAEIDEVIEDAECVKEGLATYNASVTIDDVEYTDSEEEVLPMTNVHVYVDGYCNMCEKQDPATHGVCEHHVSATLTSGGTYIIALDGNKIGTYTLTAVEGGWTIKDENGKYLSVADKTLATSSEAFVWAYSNGQFSTTVTTTKVVSSGNAFLDAIFGGKTETVTETYYLASSGNSATVSTGAASASFFTTASSEYHSFDSVVYEPTCTESGYTALTCTRCGYSATDGEKSALGHSYSENVVAPTCDNNGYTEHTCATCGNVYKDNEVNALGHNIVDDVCQNCGQPDYVLYGECTYRTETFLSSGGTYTLSLGGTETGTYSFTSVNGGWTIKDENGKYLAVDSNGSLTRSENSFTWTYSDGKFSAVVSKASSNWLEALLGGSKSTTYYLVASNGNVGVSTSGTNAKFYVDGKESYHDFEKNVVNPSCSESGYTEYVCSRCGYHIEKDFVDALEHNYTHKHIDATCTTDGGDIYTCTLCGDSKTENKITAFGHSFGDDGLCVECGEPNEPDCVYDAEQTLANGTYDMNLGGTGVGTYTFTSVEGGWTIKDANGKYVSFADNSVVYSDEAYTWTYSNGRFSTSSGSSGTNWLEILFGASRKTTYYLVSSGNTLSASTSTSSASAKFYSEVTGEHSYGAVKSSEGFHVSTCSYCGYVKSEICNDENCALCNASIDVSVKIEENSSDNWLLILFGKNSTTYTATITTVASGTEVESVEYSLDGKTWTKGNSFTSESAISSFNVRVNATNGITYNYSYSNGSVEFLG